MENYYSQEYETSEINQSSMPPKMGGTEYNSVYNAEERQRMINGFPGLNSMQDPMGTQFMQPFPNQVGYPLVINLNSLSSMLSDNRKKLLSATKASNEGEVGDAIELLQHIHKNLIFLANAADLQSNSRFVLKQERELISQKDLAYLWTNCHREGEEIKKKKKPKQVKKPWTSEEQAKFLEGLKKYNNNVRKISEHIGTRTVVQVRSHLQKYKLKQEKLKQSKTSQK